LNVCVIRTFVVTCFLIAAALCQPASGDSVVVINEIHYQPENQSLEYVELYNFLSVQVDLSGWRFEGGITFDFPEGTVIEPKGYLVIAKNPVALELETGFAGALGPFEGALANEGEVLRLWNNNSAMRTRPLPSPPPSADELWSVDIQGDGVGGVYGQVPPEQMVGPEPSSGLGGFWNAFTIPGHPAVVSDPMMALKDSSGADSSISFSISGTVSGFSMPASSGSSALFADYLFLNAGNSDRAISWRIDGLDPSKSYSLWLYSSVLRSVRLKVDVDGDGSLLGNPFIQVPANGATLVTGIRPKADGSVSGGADTPGGEVNWGGLQLLAATEGDGGSIDPGLPNKSLELRRLMEEVAYGVDGDWPTGPGGSGFTLAKVDPRAGGQASNWAVSAQVNGTPGNPNFIESVPMATSASGLLSVQGPTLALHEVSGSADESFRIELVHWGLEPIALDGWKLIDGSSGSTYHFPAEVSVAGGEFLVIGGQEAGLAPLEGAVLFLQSPDRLADSMRVGSQLRGRQVPGTGRWLTPITATFGEANVFDITDEIVINEIFHSAPGGSDEEWLEIYNRGAEAVDVSGWRLADGIDYQFPASTVIEAGGYLVVAKDKVALQAKYPDLSIVGNYEGRLGDEDRVLLEDLNGNPADEVDYYSGAPWPTQVDKGGSSLELCDPAGDNSRPEAWAASATSHLGEWQEISYSGVATDDGIGNDAFNDLLIGLLDQGEVLIDDISVRESPEGANIELIQNGTFEADEIGKVPASWRCMGNHGQGRSVVAADPDDPSNQCFRIVSTGATEDKHNRVESTFAGGRSVVVGRTYRISFRARWVGGSGQLNTRLYFNHLQRTTILSADAVWGTPGQPNSALVRNLGPTFRELSHRPVVPASGMPATVSVKPEDPDGIEDATLFYRIGSGPWQSIRMEEDAPGTYAATVPGQAAGSLMQYYIVAVDASGARSMCPPGGADGGAFIAVSNNDADVSGLRGNLRVLVSPENQSWLFAQINRMSNDTVPATVIEDETHVYCGCELRLKGSAFGRFQNTEFGYNIRFPSDRKFRGVHTSVSIERAGNMKEIVAKHILNRAGGGHWSQYDDVARIHGPGVAGIGLIAASRTTGVFLDGLFPDLPRGTVFNHELLYQPNGTMDGSPESHKLNFPYNHDRGTYDLVNRGEDKEVYRWGWQIRSKRLEDDYSSIVRLNQAFSLSGEAFVDEIERTIDVDQWMRTWAIMGLYGNDDQFGRLYAHNWRLYQRPTDGRLMALPWDLDRAFNLETASPLVPDNHAVRKLFAIPSFRRSFDSHLLDIVNTTFNSTYLTEWVEHLATVTGQGGNFAGIPSYVMRRANHAEASLPPKVPFSIITNGGADFVTSASKVTLEGNGWVDVRSVHRSGFEIPLDVIWISATRWQTEIALRGGVNSIELIARDPQGLEVGAAEIAITSESPNVAAEARNLVVAELHYHPHSPTPSEVAAGFSNDRDFEFIELQNIDSTASIDLSGVRFDRGIRYTVAHGTVVPPHGRVVIPRRGAAFAMRYPGVEFLAEYWLPTDPEGNQLSNSGEEIRLVSAAGEPIKWFEYRDIMPWPVEADGTGRSLTLISPRSNPDHNDPLSWRASLVDGGTPGVTDSLPFLGDANGDQNHDGIPDLVNYAMGDGAMSAAVMEDAGMFILTVDRDPTAEVLLQVEVSADLQPGSWLPVAREQLLGRTPLDSRLERLEFAIPSFESGNGMFFRLRASLD
jgi:hypothetical protein